MNLEYRAALGYAAVAGTGWLTIAIRQWTIRQRYMEGAARFFAEGNGENARLALGIAGGRLAEAVIAALVMAVFFVAAVALGRRTWHSWDVATVTVGIAAVISLVMLCASGRVIYFAPVTLFPFWWLLHRPGVKAACGVGSETAEDLAAAGTGDVEIVDIRRERETLTGLQQSLRVFEVERAMDTDVFVARYAQGLEDDNEDNAEWFALARMARRTQDRLAAANGRLAE